MVTPVFMFIAPGPLELLIIAAIVGVPAIVIIALIKFLGGNKYPSEHDSSSGHDSFWSDWGDNEGQQEES